MYLKQRTKIAFLFLLCTCVLALGFSGENQIKKALTYKDMMQFKHIRNPAISEDGVFLAYGLQPDRGDGEARIHNIKDDKVFSIERGSAPKISKNSRWVAMVIKPRAVEMEMAKEKKKPKAIKPRLPTKMAMMDGIKPKITAGKNVPILYSFPESGSELWQYGVRYFQMIPNSIDFQPPFANIPHASPCNNS